MQTGAIAATGARDSGKVAILLGAIVINLERLLGSEFPEIRHVFTRVIRSFTPWGWSCRDRRIL
jgi:hypothetical protein